MHMICNHDTYKHAFVSFNQFHICVCYSLSSENNSLIYYFSSTIMQLCYKFHFVLRCAIPPILQTMMVYAGVLCFVLFNGLFSSNTELVNLTANQGYNDGYVMFILYYIYQLALFYYIFCKRIYSNLDDLKTGIIINDRTSFCQDAASNISTSAVWQKDLTRIITYQNHISKLFFTDV